MQTATNGSFILVPMFKARKGGFKTISISDELFFSIFGEKSFDKHCLQWREHLNLSGRGMATSQRLDRLEKVKLWWDRRRRNIVAFVSAEALELGKINSAPPKNIDIKDVKCFLFFNGSGFNFQGRVGFNTAAHMYTIRLHVSTCTIWLFSLTSEIRFSEFRLVEWTRLLFLLHINLR